MSQFIEMFGGGNWTQKCLGEVGSFKRGGGFQKSDYVEHGIPCIHYGQIHTLFGAFIFSHITEISSDLESKTKFASKGDLIIAITSEDAEGSCKSTAWLGDYPVAVGGHAAIFHHCMNPLYMSFFFKSTLFNHAKMEYIHGTKVFEIRPDDIAKILVPCPPISLQEQFSAIAEQADKSEFDGFKSQFIEMFKETVRIKLGDYITTQSGGTPNTKKPEYYEGGTIPWLSSGEINQGYIYKTERSITQDGLDNSSAKWVPKDSVVIAMYGATAGKVGYVKIPLTTNQAVCALLPNETFDSRFLYYAVSSKTEWMMSQCRGAAQSNISQGIIRNMELPLPSFEEQTRFSSVIEQADKSENRSELKLAS